MVTSDYAWITDNYRKHSVNRRTIKYAYSLPNIEEAFSVLTVSKWYHRPLSSDNEREKQVQDSFCDTTVFWEFNRMPQGSLMPPVLSRE